MTMLTRGVITLCGSKKFSKYFKEVKLDLTRKGYVVLSPNFDDEFKFTKDDLLLLKESHQKKLN